MKYFFTLALTLLTLVSFSQSKQFRAFGTIISAEDQTPLESATVYLESAKDSTMVTYSISDRNGAFSLENRTSETELKLFISFMGYRSFSKTVQIDKVELELGTTSLKTDTMTLDEIFVRSTTPIPGPADPLESNTASFK